ncbi:ferroxidase fet3 [Coemansia javaensis]|uniref:Ferroxidase fet3 n=1 Tax=Coemansia javaensis TaxID=2761396 RepID=A0A9W8HLL7_9FUNG|nr:ferroxidase fet3 [Coemansia javaensis]
MKWIPSAPARAALAVAVLAALGACKRVVVEWDVGYVVVNRDGHNLRRAIGANGKLPIPPVRAVVGDTLELRVRNSLDESTSIHAHGLFQRNATHMDGPAMATQCGIPPGGSFAYVYNLDQAGTFWLHGHDHHQNSDGLRAPLVVYDRPGEAPFRYDQDILLSMEDWYREEFAERAMQTLDPHSPFPPPHGYGFGLLNGVDGNLTRPLHFTPGRAYRLRLVNMSSLMWFKFSIAGHKLDVIEIDGEYTSRLPVDGINVGPAQRYSVLVAARPTAKFNYRYTAVMHTNFIPPAPGLSPRVYTGDVVYSAGAPLNLATKPVPDSPGFKWLDDIELCALDGAPALVPDRQITLEVGSNLYTTGQRLDHINNITYAPPNVPTLYTALTTGSDALDPRIYGPQTHAVVLGHNQAIELFINNPTALPHPLHLHGHTFQVLEYGPVATTVVQVPAEFRNATVRRARHAPPRRDTVVVPEYNYVKLRFRADNPGVWFFHCHMDIHFAMGMGMVFVEAPDVLQRTLRVPDEMYDFCHAQDISVEGNAAGRSGLDFKGLSTPPAIAVRPAGAPGRAQQH